MNYIVTGNDAYMRESVLKELLQSILPKEATEMDLDVYDSEVDQLEQVLSCAQTAPFFLSKRIVVLKRVEKLKQKSLESILTYLNNPAKHTSLVLVSDQIKKTKIWQEIFKLVKTKNVEIPKAGNLALWIKKEFESHDKNVSQNVLQLFKEVTFGQDLLYLKTEIEKISLYVGNKKDVLKEDLENIIGQNYEEDVFSLVNAISMCDSRSALQKLEKLFTKKVKPHELIGLLGWHFRKKLSSKRLGSATGKKIHKSLNLLLQTDLKLKTTAVDPVVSLETTILTLCKR